MDGNRHHCDLATRVATCLALLCAVTWISTASAQEPLQRLRPNVPLVPIPTPRPAETEVRPQIDDDEVDLGELGELLDMDISSLSQVQVARSSVAPALDAVVSTVERKTSTVGRTPAAVYVITSDMIRRSGARHVPEVLRMVPGVQVAQIDANKWAVSIRGFNGRFANKLLVQIDGRSVYNPLFGGVFWDAQGILLEDVERIEVVRGPGGAIWGDNAVNGVVNIVTRKASDTHGTFLEAGGGNTEQAFAAFRHGGSIGNSADLRVHGQWSERNAFESPTGHDAWQSGQVGARLDWELDQYDRFTLQGDFYNGESGTLSAFAQPAAPFVGLTAYDEKIAGGNVLFRWNRKLSVDSDWQLQTYYEQTRRNFVSAGSTYERHTFDVDFQHRFQANENHDLVWGASYRTYSDDLEPQAFFLSADPKKTSYDVVGLFVQDTLNLVDDQLSLTLGTKLSHNDFTGTEVQPSARLLWTPTDRVSAWLATSRAVRTSSRLVRDARIVLPGNGTVLPGPGAFPVFTGIPSLESEDVLALEAGLRHQPVAEFSWDAAVFWNRYEDLIGLGAPGPLMAGPEGAIVQIPFANAGHAETYGLELATTYQLHEDWSLRGSYNFLKMNFDGSVLGDEDDSPTNQFNLQSSHQLADNVQMDLIWRYVDSLPSQGVASYSSFNVRLAWQPTNHVDLFVMGTNLFDSEHFEFGHDPFAGTQSTEVPRGIFGGMTLRY